jgi:GIY-YIG catalytic domain-containing protein
MEDVMNRLKSPCQLWGRSQVLMRLCPEPQPNGIYAWYFKNIPIIVPTSECHEFKGLKLLYIGIAPAFAKSSATLRTRIRTHLRGNASGSTLRLTLGCLLSEQLDLRLQPTGRTARLTFADGETILSDWLEENAFVTWAPFSRPWEVESTIIRRFSLPLNLQHNQGHPFYQQLSDIRSKCKQQATKP